MTPSKADRTKSRSLKTRPYLYLISHVLPQPRKCLQAKAATPHMKSASSSKARNPSTDFGEGHLPEFLATTGPRSGGSLHVGHGQKGKLQHSERKWTHRMSVVSGWPHSPCAPVVVCVRIRVRPSTLTTWQLLPWKRKLNPKEENLTQTQNRQTFNKKKLKQHGVVDSVP